MKTSIIIALLSCIAFGCDYCKPTDDSEYDDDGNDYKGTGAMAAEGLFCIADTDGELTVVARPTPRLALDDLMVEVEAADPDRNAAQIVDLAQYDDDASDVDGVDEPVHFADLIDINTDEAPDKTGDLSRLD